MANKQQKIAQKKKKREKIVKERIFHRREKMRVFRKQEEEKARLEKELSSNKQMPIINDPNIRQMQEKNRVEMAKAQIEKNLQLLEAIEKEYDKEHALREQVNKDLEAEGHVSMKDKLDALHEKAMAMQSHKKEENS
jgi:hypothetical protein